MANDTAIAALKVAASAKKDAAADAIPEVKSHCLLPGANTQPLKLLKKNEFSGCAGKSRRHGIET
jgi:hypothetical protein